MTTIVAKFENIEDGVESYVTIGAFGFHVSLKDTDADEFVGTSICYKDKSRAIAKAAEIAA